MTCYTGAEASKILRSIILNAIQSIYVATAFLDVTGAKLLEETARRGVYIRLLASDKVDTKILEELSREGVDIKIYDEKFLHVKIYIVDGRAFVGSANLTRAALEESNIEVLCEIDAKEALAKFNELWSKARTLSQINWNLVQVEPLLRLSERSIGENKIITLDVPEPDVRLILVNPNAPGEYMIIEANGIRFKALTLIKRIVCETSDVRLATDSTTITYLHSLKNCGKYCDMYIKDFKPLRPLKDEEIIEVAKRLSLAIQAVKAFIDAFAKQYPINDMIRVDVEKLVKMLREKLQINISEVKWYVRGLEYVLDLPSRTLLAMTHSSIDVVTDSYDKKTFETAVMLVQDSDWLKATRRMLEAIASKYHQYFVMHGIIKLGTCVHVTLSMEKRKETSVNQHSFISPLPDRQSTDIKKCVSVAV